MSKSRFNTPLWTTLMVSLGLHFLALLLFGAIVVFNIVSVREEPKFEAPEPVPPPEKQVKIRMSDMSQSASNPPPMNIAVEVNRIDLPSIVFEKNPTPKNGRVNGVGGDGTGLGVGSGGMGLGTGIGINVPKILSGRCSPEERLARMKKEGGNEKCEEAVVKALNWLQEKQNQDGSWGGKNKSAMTGLALLAYLGHCETPDSLDYGETVKKAIEYIMEQGPKNGGALTPRNGHWSYSHGIATYALAEAYTMTKEGRTKFPQLEGVVTKAVDIIIKGQAPDGGWMYLYNHEMPSDTSVSGWQIQALKAAHLTGLSFPGLKKSMDKAMDNVVRVRGNQGGFGYRNAENKWSLTGVGVLALQFWGRGNSDEAEDGVDFILDNDEWFDDMDYFDDKVDLYAWYYNTQACFQEGGRAWSKWNRSFRGEVLRGQGDNGAWKQEGKNGVTTAPVRGSAAADGDAEIYRTCLCTLMLEVYYRYLPSTG